MPSKYNETMELFIAEGASVEKVQLDKETLNDIGYTEDE